MKRITEKQLRNLVAESVRRYLNEGTTDSHVTKKWEEVQEYAGAEQMLDDIFCFLSGDQVRDLTKTLCDYYEINFDDDEEEFDGDFEEFDEGRKRKARMCNESTFEHDDDLTYDSVFDQACHYISNSDSEGMDWRDIATGIGFRLETCGPNDMETLKDAIEDAMAEC